MNKDIEKAVDRIVELQNDVIWDSQAQGYDISGSADKAIEAFTDEVHADEWLDQGDMDNEEYEQAKGQFITLAVAEFNK
jgi:post-segregation antitoxin (ccd killing protein)